MIIGTWNKNTCFLHSDFFNQFEIFFACSDPAGNFGEFISSFHTFNNRITVFLRIKEEFTRTNHTVGTAEFMKIIIDCNNLFGRIRSSGLLSVSECCIRNPYFFWHIVRNYSVIKRNFGYLGIRKHVSKDIGFINVFQNIHMLFDFQKIVSGI